MDLRCYDDLDAFGSELVNDPLEELVQDLYHRLIETPGSNLDDPDRGLGIADMLSGTFDSRIGLRIEAEFRKDERVTGASAIVTPLENAGEYHIAIEVEVDTVKLGFGVEVDGLGNVRRTS